MNDPLICAALAAAVKAGKAAWLKAGHEARRARELASLWYGARESHDTNLTLASQLNDTHGAKDRSLLAKTSLEHDIDEFIDRILAQGDNLARAYMMLVTPHLESWNCLEDDDKPRALFKFAALVDLSNPFYYVRDETEEE